MPRSFAFAILLSLFYVPQLFGKPTRFEVKDAAFRNVVSWTSDALLEKTIAVAHYVTGFVELDPQNLKAGISGEFEVDVRAFEMGPESRQNRLRETLLLAAEHPGASFKIDKLLEVSMNELAPGRSVTGRVSGTFTARGVSRREEMNVRATYLPESETTKKRLTGNVLKMNATWSLATTDYKFPIPEALLGLLSPTLKFTADLLGTDQLPVATP